MVVPQKPLQPPSWPPLLVVPLYLPYLLLM
jgi:hypothetical protein